MNTTRSITAAEMKSLFKQQRLSQNISTLAAHLEKRRWTFEGASFTFGGINWEKDIVVFYRIWNEGPNCAGYHNIQCSIENAMDCISGSLTSFAITTALSR